ncbi:MAG: 4Fe-4S binding protein [Armatimonadetes bacterium]|nr:4Fe-4S binding protein [Armatimonadota bacterium]
MPTITIDREICKGCELCAHFCPQKIIKMADGFNSKGYRVSCLIDCKACTGCALCAKICPDVAIEVWR